MDVNESDHKPVQCKFHVKIAHADRSVRRQSFGEIMSKNDTVRSTLKDLSYVPEISISNDSVVLQNQDTMTIRITNTSKKDKAVYKIICEGQSTVKEEEESGESRPRGCFGFPRWLEVIGFSSVSFYVYHTCSLLLINNMLKFRSHQQLVQSNLMVLQNCLYTMKNSMHWKSLLMESLRTGGVKTPVIRKSP